MTVEEKLKALLDSIMFYLEAIELGNDPKQAAHQLLMEVKLLAKCH